MSKAFTKEDDLGTQPVLRPLVSLVPEGAKNYLTAKGAARLQDELGRSLNEQRPALLVAGASAREENREALMRLDQRIAYLQQSLRSAEIATLPPLPHDVVRFGATVDVRDARGQTLRYRIVGVDEAEPEHNAVSWLSPIARALLNARLGQRVPFRFPAGLTQLEITAITYE
ncbi:transcription elongation factor GreB [Opitutaceae bacterium]